MKKITQRQNKLKLNKTTLLIALCWIVYTCSYIGKLGYNANITLIESQYSVSHSTAGLVSTYFFFAYGIGQIINGILCKKYNLRVIVFVSLIVSGLMNILVATCTDFALLKYYWLINGVVLAVLYPSLMRLLAENLEEKQIARAIIAMGTTVAVGTLLTYLLSALFVAVASYVITFILAGILLPLCAVLWFLVYPKLVKNQPTIDNSKKVTINQKPKIIGSLWVQIIVLAVFAIVVNLVKDGLTTWVPMILKETYLLPDYVSILLTILLPILAIFGTGLAIKMNKKIANLVTLSSVLFLVSGLFLGVVILCLPTNLFIITVVSFAVVACLMSAINNVITSMAPLFWKEKVNSGLLAGIFNGFCYVGSTLSSFGLGSIADASGWSVVFWLLFGLCVLMVILGAIYKAIAKISKNQIL